LLLAHLFRGLLWIRRIPIDPILGLVLSVEGFLVFRSRGLIAVRLILRVVFLLRGPLIRLFRIRGLGNASRVLSAIARLFVRRP